ncbi:MAG: hypothetical protein RSD95_03855 [Clostridia bacterium]
MVGEVVVRFIADTTGLKAASAQMAATTSQIKAKTTGIRASFASMAASAKASFATVSTSMKGAAVSMIPSTGKMGGALSGLAGKLGIAAIAVGALVAAIGFLNDSAKETAQSIQVNNQFMSVFGSSAKEARKDVIALSKEYKVYSDDLLQFSATLGQAIKSTGNSAKVAADMSYNLSRMAYDASASIANLSVKDAMESIKGAMSEQAKGLKKLGIVITDVDLKNYALKNGILKGAEQFTAATKQTAIYQMMMEKLSTTQGAYKKNSDTLGNTNAELSASFSDLKQTLGEVFLPVIIALKKAISFLIGIISEGLKYVIAFAKIIFNTIMKVVAPIYNAIAGLFGLQKIEMDKAADDTKDATDDMSGSMDDMADAADKTGESIRESLGLAGFDRLNVMTRQAAENMEEMSDMDMGSIFDPNADSGESSAGKSIDDIQGKMEGLFDKIRGWGMETFGGVFEFAGKAWGNFSEIGGKVWESIKTTGSNVWGVITAIASGDWGKVGRIMGDQWNAVKETAGEVWESISGTAGEVWEGIESAAGDVWSVIKTFGEGVWNGLGSFASDVWKSVAGFVQEIFQGVIDTITGWLQPIIDAVKWVVDKVSGIFGGVGDFFGSLWGGIKGAVGLADGGVVSPNKPFPVIVGDNKRENEIIAPVSTMQSYIRQAVSEAVSGSDYGGGSVNVTIELDGKILARQMYDYNKSEARRRGVNIG